jgi:hypothetical protein
MRKERNVSAEQTVKTFMTALQSGDMELAANLMADDFILGGLTPTPLTKSEFLALQSDLLTAMPDFSFNLSGVHRVEDEVHAFIRITGTHTGDLALPTYGLRNVAATGLAVALPQVGAAFQFERDRIVGMRVESVTGGGLTGLLQQIGAELPLQPRISNITNLSE